MYSRWLRNSFIYLLILVAVIAIVFAFFSSGDDHEKVPFGQIVQDAQANQIQKIEVDGLVREGIHAFYRPIAWGSGADEPVWSRQALVYQTK